MQNQKIKLTFNDVYRDGGTRSYIDADHNEYFLDNRRGSTTKGLFDRYPGPSAVKLDIALYDFSDSPDITGLVESKSEVNITKEELEQLVLHAILKGQFDYTTLSEKSDISCVASYTLAAARIVDEFITDKKWDWK